MVGVAVNVTDALAHTVVVGVVMVTDGVTEPLMVIVIVFEVAVVGDAHAELDVITHVTVWPLVSVVVVYVALLVPTFVPFTCHWYDGVVPPLVGVAVNVTELLVQLGFAPLVIAILTAGVTELLTVIVIELDVAVVGDAQVALEVITQVTACPLVSVVVV